MKIKSLSECRQQDDLIKIDPVMIITGSEGARGGQKRSVYDMKVKSSCVLSCKVIMNALFNQAHSPYNADLSRESTW